MIVDWQKIDTVMLDMDGTLLDLHYDNYFWKTYLPNAYAEKLQISLDEAQNDLIPQFEEKQGHIDWYCTDYWADVLCMDIVDLKKQAASKIRFRPGAEAFLKHLKQQQKSVWLVTNAHRDVLKIKCDQLPLSSYFEHMISSHDFSEAKESQLFWQQLQQNFIFDENRTLFIDDSLPVLRSAQKFGIQHLLTVSLPDLLDEPKDTQEFAFTDDFSELF